MICYVLVKYCIWIEYINTKLEWLVIDFHVIKNCLLIFKLNYNNNNNKNRIQIHRSNSIKE